ncbi:hypothetical protein BDP27DRAFT_300541 [Rhodocollybia butyracea]|uniref:Uncharacterized protein n=1 Tax=Rhodocollybia butyracea TaxID=206335 RepID=A0A9P5Q0S4_9AGAR|nr:hypothetical protein BDP27DRAFT_300541 [Rhodocollybia butyracea]
MVSVIISNYTTYLTFHPEPSLLVFSINGSGNGTLIRHRCVPWLVLFIIFFTNYSQTILPSDYSSFSSSLFYPIGPTFSRIHNRVAHSSNLRQVDLSLFPSPFLSLFSSPFLSPLRPSLGMLYLTWGTNDVWVFSVQVYVFLYSVELYVS